ncbi:MAG: hypothetical protein JNM39_18870 [Bdellovibrionaceae bacterium]|nr:hypothetical protein [Pseudobdellovibrionaceae bacterium]
MSFIRVILKVSCVYVLLGGLAVARGEPSPYLTIEQDQANLCKTYRQRGQQASESLKLKDSETVKAWIIPTIDSYYTFQSFCRATLSMEPTRGNEVLAKIIEKSDFFSSGKQDYSNYPIVQSCLDALLTCQRTEGVKILVSGWKHLLGRDLEFDIFLKSCKEKALSFGSCTHGKLLQETLSFNDLQRKSLQDFFTESSVSKSLTDCEEKRIVNFEFNPYTLIWAKVLGARTSAESRGNLDLDIEIRQGLKGGFDRQKLTIKWPYLDTRSRKTRPGPQVGMELLLPFREEDGLYPDFSECILIANQKNAEALRTKERKILTPYSQNLCKNPGESLGDRTWIDVRSRTIHDRKQNFIRFQPTTGQEIVLMSNNHDGEESRKYRHVRTDCINQYLVVEEGAWESQRVLVYSPLSGEKIVSEESIRFSSDGRYALAWSQSDHNSLSESHSIQLVKLTDGKVEYLWSKGDKKLRYDIENDGAPVFDKGSVKFIVQKILGEVSESEDSESSTQDSSSEIRRVRISCPLDANKKCTEKEIDRSHKN